MFGRPQRSGCELGRRAYQRSREASDAPNSAHKPRGVDMDALTFLSGEHRTVLGILELLETSGRASANDLRTMVNDLIIAETRRARIETQVFWPAVRNALHDGDALADRAIAQEEAAKNLRRRLVDRHPNRAGLSRALAEFVAATRKRMMDEEDSVWPRFAALVGPDELQNLGRTLELARSVSLPN
jgi:hypothetical protein